MSACSRHTTTHADACEGCTLERIEALLERLADALAPTPEQRALLLEEFQFEASKRNSIEAQIQRAQAQRRPSMTNAIAGPQTGRGVR